MEGKSRIGGNTNMMPNASSYSFLDLQGSIQSHNHPHNPHTYQSSMVSPQPRDSFNLRIGNPLEPFQRVSFPEYDRVELTKNALSDDEVMTCGEEGVQSCKGTIGSTWQRVKWTDKMVVLLITSVSYIGEDSSSDCSARRRACILHKKGKWKTISKVMGERGFYVSPQQCEDKFNDLNKRYKRLNDVLGRGTTCQVVEKPSLLDFIDIPEKSKDDVKKILSSKHLFYEQMCSYHNGNRLNLPHDPDLQRSIQLVLKNRDDYEPPDWTKHREDVEFDEEDHDDEMEEDISATILGVPSSSSARRMRLEDEYDVNLLDCNKRPESYMQSDGNADCNLPEGMSCEKWMTRCSFQLMERKIHIQEQMIELEKQRIKWQRFSKNQERELDDMRLENERIKMENDQMVLELKRKEFKAAVNN